MCVCVCVLCSAQLYRSALVYSFLHIGNARSMFAEGLAEALGLVRDAEITGCAAKEGSEGAAQERSERGGGDLLAFPAHREAVLEQNQRNGPPLQDRDLGPNLLNNHFFQQGPSSG